MWTDASADPLRCAGSHAVGVVAPTLPNGFPGGRALCRACLEFVAIDGDGRLAEHETSSAETGAADRAEWFNTFGWPGDASRS